MADVVMKTGDTAPLVRQLTGSDAAIADLTGATVRFLMRRRGGRLTKVAAVADVVAPATNGTVSYSWVTADVNEPGWFEAEFEVTFANGKLQSFPNGRYLEVLFEEGLG